MGTVREDYSETGEAWSTFPTTTPVARVPLGRGRARRFLRSEAAAVFRGGALERKDPILKERLFGLSNAEGTTART